MFERLYHVMCGFWGDKKLDLKGCFLIGDFLGGEDWRLDSDDEEDTTTRRDEALFKRVVCFFGGA